MSESSVLETLSKEQIEVLLSLVPVLTQRTSATGNLKPSCSESHDEAPTHGDSIVAPQFMNAEMLLRKKKNT